MRIYVRAAAYSLNCHVGAMVSQGRRSLWDRGDMFPDILWRGTSMVMPPNILEFLYFAARFILSSSSSNCWLLYFNANIMCSFTQKKLQLLGTFLSQTPYRGSAPGPRSGTSVPQTPSLLSCPPVILWDRPPWRVLIAMWARASLFRRFSLRIQTYTEPVPLKYGKLAIRRCHLVMM